MRSHPRASLKKEVEEKSYQQQWDYETNLMDVKDGPQVDKLAKDQESGPEDPAKLGDLIVCCAVFGPHRHGPTEDRSIHQHNDDLAYPKSPLCQKAVVIDMIIIVMVMIIIVMFIMITMVISVNNNTNTNTNNNNNNNNMQRRML